MGDTANKIEFTINYLTDIALGNRISAENSNFRLVGANPVSGNSVTFSSSFTGNQSISITDLKGRTLLTQNINSGMTAVNINGLPAGIYHAVLNRNGVPSARKKFIKE
ncbi:MAG: T9SS type A sorting domain-containing protein [Bacteroidota bacterium]